MRASYHRLLGAFAALLLAAPAGTAHAAEAAQAARHKHRTAGALDATLVIDGAGDGHGVGMSQEGALGYAQHGYSYEQILAHYYTGTALGQAPAKTVVKVLLHGKVKRVPLENYVRGVVAAEVSADWPMAALEAQAVASRTYALTAHAGGKRFDVYADTRSQMYLGRAAETPRSNAAVKATEGQIVTYEGKSAVTYFFASSGGHTESVQEAWPGASPQPWLVGVDDPYDTGPLHRWTLSFSFKTAEKRLKGLVQGRLRGIEVLRRGVSPRVLSAYVLGTKGRTLVSGAQLAERFGCYSTWMRFSMSDAKGTHAEPDASGQQQDAEAPAAPAPATTPAVPAAAQTVAATPEGGTSGPAVSQAQAAGASGGTAAL